MNKKIFLLLLVFAVYSSVFSQAAWDIDYINIDSVNLKDIGREMQLDFKDRGDRDIGKSWRSFISRKDTGTLTIDNISLEIKEIRIIYADWGLYKEQYMESVKEVQPGIKLRIVNSVIKEVKADSILILANIELFRVRRKKSYLVENRTTDIWVERDKLSGLLYRRK